MMDGKRVSIPRKVVVVLALLMWLLLLYSVADYSFCCYRFAYM